MADTSNPVPPHRTAQRIAVAAHRRNGLDEQARTALEKTATANPEDWRTLLRLADLHRRQGDLQAALGLYQRVAAQAGDAKAAWLSAVLSGAALPNAPAGDGPSCGEEPWPAPFVRIKNFLPPHRCDSLLALALANRRNFVPAIVGAQGTIDPNVRRGLHAGPQVLWQVGRWFFAKLLAALPEVLPRVRLSDLDDYKTDLKMTASLAGSDFKIHQDRNESFPDRLLSWAYYFHRQPQRFSGGDLLLHDCAPNFSRVNATFFTRLAPLHNSIVFFPSGFFHQMTPVEAEPEDFDNCRFALNGHFCLQQDEGASG